MEKRIKELRKAMGLTQSEFGEKVGIKQSTVASYEAGVSRPLDAIITLICKTFAVSERWLRDGEGEMFVRRSRDEDVAYWVARLMSDEHTEFQRRMISALSKLDTAAWEQIELFCRSLVADDAPNKGQDDA